MEKLSRSSLVLSVFSMLLLIMTVIFVYSYNTTSSNGATLTIWSAGDLQAVYVNQTIFFFANYTNNSAFISSATCNITFNDTTSSWIMNGSSNSRYNFSRNFTNAGTYKWNVSCNMTGYAALNISDLVMITKVFYLDPTYSGGTKNGNAITPWTTLDSGAWTLINNALASENVIIYFSARQQGSDTAENYTTDIDLSQKTSTSSHMLILNGRSYYNTNDSNPSWILQNGTAKTQIVRIISQNDVHVKYSDITIDGFTVYATPGGKAISICGDNWTIINSDISNAPGNYTGSDGPLINLIPTADGGHEGSSAYCPPCSNLIVENNIIHDSYGELLYLGGGGCSQNDPTGDTYCMGFPAHHNILVINNTFYNGGDMGAQGDGIDVKGGMYNLTITGNNFSHVGVISSLVRSIVMQGMNLEGPNQNILVEKNYIHDSAYHEDAAIAIENSWGTPKGVTIRNNIIANNTRGSGIEVYDGSNISIFSNTIYNNLDYGIYIQSGNVTVIDNLIINNNGGGVQVAIDSGNIVSRSNGYSGASWPGTCTNCYSGRSNQEFINATNMNFHLKSNSSMINTGENLTGFSDDFDNNIRPQGTSWDIGAYEYVPISTNLSIFSSGNSYVNSTAFFFANYSDATTGSFISGATCNITFNNTNSSWIMNGSSNSLYNFSRNFSNAGNYLWNVSCNKTGYQSLTISDMIIIQPTVCGNRTYYIDFLNGDDSKSGNCTNVAWKHAPGMVGFSATYAHSSGDKFIFRGGVSWNSSNFPMTISNGGTGLNPDYYGVNFSWYYGTSWSRPVFNDEGISNSSFIIHASNNVYVDNIEFNGYYWSSNQSWSTTSYVRMMTYYNLTYDHCYLHNWTHAGAEVGNGDNLDIFVSSSTAMASIETQTVKNCIIDGSPNGTDAGMAWHGGGNLINTTIKNIPNCFLPCAFNARAEGNNIGPITVSFSGRHENAIENNGVNNTFYIVGNYIHDLGSGVISIFAGGFGGTEYIYNNVIFNITRGIPIDVESRYTPSNIRIYNNILYAETGFSCVNFVGANNTLLFDFQNNYCINAVSLNDTANVTTAIISNNLFHTAAQSVAAGYNVSNNFMPKNSTQPTVDNGTDLSAYFTTDILGTSRPQGSAWDIGAYEYPQNNSNQSSNISLSIFSSANLTSVYLNQTVLFYANYSDNDAFLSGATCNITFNDTTSSWIMNGLSNSLYNFSRNFTNAGIYTWNVICNNTGYLTLNTTDTLNVTDNIPPYITLYYPTNTTYNTNNITINFTASDTSGIDKIWFYNETNNISYIAPTSVIVSQGNHKFIFYANDTFGNLNSTNISFFVDSIVPSISFTTPTTIAGNYSQNFITANISVNDTNLNIYTIFLYNTTSIVRQNSTSTFINFTGLSDGTYYINATANDTVNNRNWTTTSKIIIDTTPPVFTQITNLSVLDNQTVSYNINATDNIVGVNCFSINDTSNFAISCGGLLSNNTRLNFNKIYWINVTVNDTLNNRNSQIIYVNVSASDTTPPSITIYSPQNITYNNATLLVNFTATDSQSGIDTIWYFNTTSNKTYTLPQYVTFAQGGNTIIFYANDTRYGNLNSTNVSFFVDSIYPSINFSSQTTNTGNYSQNYIYINISYFELNPDKLIINLYNETGSLLRQNKTSSSVNFTTLFDGIYYINATINDTAGNKNNTNTRKILLDTTPPSILNVANLTTIENQTWSYQFMIINSLAGFDKISINDTNNFQVSQTGNFTNNTHEVKGQFFYLTVMVNDTLNNQRNYTFTLNVTIPDTVGPTITILSPQNQSYTTNNITISALFYDTSGVSASWYSNGTQNKTYTGITSMIANQGSNTLIFYSNDTLGNNNSANITFNVDSIIPLINFQNPTPQNNNYSRNYIEINASSSDTNLDTTTIYLYNSSSLIVQNKTSKFINVTGLPDGYYYFNATVNDTFGNNNMTNTRQIILDTTPPMFTQVANLSILDNQTLNYNITASDNIVGVNCFSINDTSNFIILCNGSISNNTRLNFNKIYFINVTVNDTLNNRNSQIIYINVSAADTTPPILTIFSPNNITYNNATLLVNVTAYDSQSGIDTIWYFNTTSNKTYTLPEYVMFAQGQNTVIFYANDTRYANINSTNVSFFIDSIAPSIFFNSPAQNTNYSRNYIEVNLSVSDANLRNFTSYLYNQTGTIIKSNSTSTFINFTNIADGIYYLNATANDTANNRNGTSTIKIIIDTTTPAITLNYPINATYNTTNISINFTATDLNSVDKMWFYNESNNITYAAPTSVIVSQGNHRFIFYANDTFGNINSTNVSFFVDSIYPSINFSSQTTNTGNYSQNYIYINISYIETNPDTLIINLYNQTGSLLRQNKTSSNVNFTSLLDGIYYINATLNDTAGNINNTNTRKILLDTTPPSILNVANITTIENQTWSYQFMIVNSLAGFDRITINDTNNFQVSQTGNFTNNTHEVKGQFFYLTVMVNDTLNNQRNYTFTLNVTIPDTVGPTITILSPQNQSYTTNNITISALFYDTSGVSASWYSNGTQNKTYTGITSMIANQGSNTLIFYSNDTLGNNNSANITFNVDSIIPLINFQNPTPQNNNYSRNYIEINASSSDTNLDTTTIYLYNSSSLIVQNKTSKFINVTGLPDGYYYFNATVNDTFGNNNMTNTRQIILDTTPPMFTQVANLSILDNQTLNYNITASDNIVGVNCFSINDTSNFIILCNGSISNNTRLNFNKIYFINVTVNDTLNNRNSQIIYINVSAADTTPPILTIFSPNNITYNNATLLVNVTAYDSQSGIDTIWYFNTTSNKTYTLPEYVMFAQGQNTVIFYANDTRYANINSTNVSFFIDSIAPSIFFNSPAQNTNYSRNYIEVNLSVSDANLRNFTSYLYNQTGTIIKSNSTSTFINFTNIADGIYYLNATANDTANNRNGTSTIKIIIDTTTPAITLNYPINATYNTTNISINFTATDLNSVDKMWFYNESNNITYAAPTSVIVSQGNHRFIFYANDTFGNINSTNVSFFVDSIYPSINFSSQTTNTGNYSQNYIYINISYIETNPDTLIINLYNQTGSLLRQNKTSSNVNFTSLLDGIYYINATLNDTAGNINNTNTRKILLDTTPPSILNVANITTIENQTWSYQFMIVNSLAGFDRITINDTNNFQVSQTGNFTNNTHEVKGQFFYLTVMVNDTLNNQRNYTFTLNVTIPDTVGPTITIISPLNASYNVNNITISLSVFDTSGVSKTWYSNGTQNNTYTGITSILANQGSNTLFFYSNDTLGNNNSANITFNVDSIIPLINFQNPTPQNNNYSRNYIEINASSSDTNLDTTTIYLYNSSSPIVQNKTSKFINVTNLPDGYYYFNATVNDTFGNNNMTNTRQIILDTTPPQFTNIVNLTIQEYQNVFYDINATDNIAGVYCFSINDTTNFQITCNGILTNITFLLNNTYYLNISVNDTLGNKISQNIFVNVTRPIDLSNPSITVFSPIENTTYISSNVLINFSASDNVMIDKMWYYNEVSNISYTIPLVISLSNANYNFTFYTNDTSGNINSTSVDFTVSYTAPVVTPPPNNNPQGGGSGIGGNFVAVTPENTKQQFLIQNNTQILNYINISANTTETPNISVTENEISANNPIKNEKVFGYFYVESNINQSAIQNITISVKVNNSWIQNQNVNTSTIQIQQYDNDGLWNPLDTIPESNDSIYHYFKAYTNYLSSFAVTGLENINNNKTTEIEEEKNISESKNKTYTNKNSSIITKTESKNNPVPYFAGISVILLALGAGFFVMLKQKPKIISDPNLEISNENTIKEAFNLVNKLRETKETADKDINKAIKLYEEARIIYETLDENMKQNYQKYLLGIYDYLDKKKIQNTQSQDISKKEPEPIQNQKSVPDQENNNIKQNLEPVSNNSEPKKEQESVQNKTPEVPLQDQIKKDNEPQKSLEQNTDDSVPKENTQNKHSEK